MGISNISAGATTMDQFRQDLERGLGRPVVDETGLEGVNDLEVHGNGLVLTNATRSIEILTLRSLN